MAHFELQPDEKQLQELADQAWSKASYRDHELEKLAFEAGASIRGGDHSLANLEAIVRWKSDRLVEYLTGNSKERIERVLATAARPDVEVREAIDALTSLRGIDLPMATAIMTAIAPERFAELDYRVLEAVGHSRHNTEFYAEYLEFCHKLADKGIVNPQKGLPGPAPLHTLDRALAEWSRCHGV